MGGFILIQEVVKIAEKVKQNARNSLKLTPRGASKPEIVKRILDSMPEYKANYVFWRYAPECMTCTLENKSFDSFKAAAALPEHFTEDSCKMWLLDADVQDLVRLLLERKNQQQLLDLHEKYVVKAENDPNSLKALLQLNETLFKNTGNQLYNLLDAVPDDVIGEEISK